MTDYCTLFDSNYLSRGLAMHHSLIEKCPSFHLYILAFDDLSLEFLRKAKLPHVTVIGLSDFESEDLLAIKPTRSKAEYCWTCTPAIILYCLEHFHLSSCTYLDADLIFYQDPNMLVEEAIGRSVIISEHRYTPAYDVSATHGIYCVQFMYFKNDKNGKDALQWWRNKCLDWCFARQEDGKFGDQKYLDDWPYRFPGVHVLQNPGAGIAPWNIQQFNILELKENIYLSPKGSGHSFPLIFYHFHGVKFFTDQQVSLTGSLYEISGEAKNLIYFPYIRQLLTLDQGLQQAIPGLPHHGARLAAPSKLNIFIEFMKERLMLLVKSRISLFQIRNFSFRKHFHFYSLTRF